MYKLSQNEVEIQTKETIAIIGVGFKGPGAENLEQLWDILETGQNLVVDHPNDRWNVDAFYDADPQAHRKYYTKKAGFMSNPLAFDNEFFGINDMESDQMDPQQKHVLECTYKAMEHAGLTKRMLKGSTTGVYIGAMNCDYRGLFPVGYSAVSNYTVTGVSNGIIASRVSYVFDLRGPCLVLDTGCSSALIAIHTASHGLLNGDCSLAICGGTNFIASPDIFVHLSKANMASPTGQCHAFSDLADGYTRGEGCGIVILKKLSDATRDHDRVLAVIRTGTNQDGHDVSPMSAPSKTQQFKLLNNMYRSFSLEQLNEVEYIEAHGTGTQAGDFAEAHALGEFFNSRKSSKKRLIGSIKTNIGHLEAAAGAAGLIKVLLMMEHNKIVPSLLTGDLNKKINFDELNLKVVTELRDWGSEKKVASVNSFGFGGSNCHAIVRSLVTEKADYPRSIEDEKDNAHCIVCFSGKDDVSLLGSLKDLAEYKELRSLNLHDISFTSTRRRDHYPKRKAFVVASIEELINKVTSSPQQQATVKQLSVIFVFGGMGTSWNGMCQEMLVKSVVFRSTLRSIDQCLQKYVEWSLIERLNHGTDLDDPLFSPIAIFACEVGLAKVWQRLGVEPSLVVGQSVGEVAAAYTADCLSLQDAVQIIYERSLLLSGVMGGKMFIVKNMDIDLVKDVMTHYCGKANVSVEYSPLTCAVSCNPEVLEEIKRHLLKKASEDKAQITFIDLQVPTAYHSHLMDSIKPILRNRLKTTSSQKSSKIPMISTVTGKKVNYALDADYWVNNLREPVKFYDAVRASFSEHNMNIFLEIGPRPVLKAHMQNIFTEKNVTNFASVTLEAEWNQFLETSAALYCLGVNINWLQLPQLGRQVTPVPRYCFHTRKGFFKSEQAHLALAGVNCLRHTHPYVYKKSSTESMVMISENTFPSVYEHKVANMLVIPGAFYAEIGFAVTKFHHNMKDPMYMLSAKFKQPFRLPREGSTVLSIECLQIHNNTHCCENESDRYKIIIQNEDTILASLELYALKSKIFCQNLNIQFVKGRCPVIVKKEDIYSSLKKYGFTYGPRFSLLEVGYRSQHECIAEMVIPEFLNHEIPGTTIHPSVIDCMMQTSAILENVSGIEQEILPVSIGKLTSYREIDKRMYVVATQKEQQGDFTFYDVILTTLDGQVIALMESLSHTIVSKKTENLSPLYNSVWTKLDKINSNPDPKMRKVLFITDYIPPDTPSHTLVTCHIFDSLQRPQESFNGKMPILNNSFDFILVLIVNCSIADSDDGDLVLKRTTNLCLFLQQLYNYAFTQRFKKPIFVFTKGAFELESPEDGAGLQHSVNPVMTSLWGLFRCAVHESISESVSAVDLHVPTEAVSFSLLTSVVQHISNDAELQLYPEFLITEKYIYVNEIVKLGTDTPIPSFRLNHADINTYCSILSNHPSTLDTTCCVYKQRSDGHAESTKVKMDISEAAIPNPDLFSVKCLYGKGKDLTHSSDEGFMIFALETNGVVKVDGSQNVDVVSCFPVPLASKIVVPKTVTIDTSMLYQYKLGDVTQLTVLMALCSKVKTSSVTLLASKSTFHLARGLEIMLKTFNPSKNVNIVMIESFDKTNEVNETVITLVLLDQAIIWKIDSMKVKPKQFITLYTLIKDARTLFSITFPSVHLDVLDTEHLFSPIQLVTIIPQLTDWIKKHQLEVKFVIELMHNYQEPKVQHIQEQTHDVSKMLEFQIYKMNPSLVKAGKAELFRGDSAYIVVGGLTGLGWLTVRHLAENGAGCIAIMNRRMVNKDMKSAIASLSLATHCEIDYFSGDVSDFRAVEGLFTFINDKFVKKVVRGIFFSALVLEDKPLIDLTKEDFLKVLLAKVKGAWNMHLMTKDLRLDYFVLYSSVSSIVGNFTQANYGAANAFMDGLSFYRRSRNLAGQSINWGALDLGILENNEEIKKKLEEKGFAIMSEGVTKNYIQPLVLLNSPQLMPCMFRDNMNEEMYSGAPAKLRKRMTSVFKWYQKEEVQINEVNVNVARSLPRDQRLAIYEQYVVELSCKVLNVDKETLRNDSNLVDYGLDSIVAMTMINYIYLHVGCRLLFLHFLSGRAIVQDIARMIDEAVSKAEQDFSHPNHEISK